MAPTSLTNSAARNCYRPRSEVIICILPIGVGYYTISQLTIYPIEAIGSLTRKKAATRIRREKFPTWGPPIRRSRDETKTCAGINDRRRHFMLRATGRGGVRAQDFRMGENPRRSQGRRKSSNYGT